MLQTTIKIMPLSVNQAYSGQRHRTEKYNQYREDLFKLLPKLNIPSGKIEISFLWGFSYKHRDCDNPIKPLIDILQDAYEFDDCRVYRIISQKVDVKKGDEFISFTIGKFYE